MTPSLEAVLKELAAARERRLNAQDHERSLIRQAWAMGAKNRQVADALRTTPDGARMRRNRVLGKGEA